MDLQIPTLHKRSRQDFDTSPAAMKITGKTAARRQPCCMRRSAIHCSTR
mgnify:CR=1 FL=1